MPVSPSENNRQIAVIISGLLRLSRENEQVLRSMGEKYDVFVCTDRSHERFLPHLGKVKSVRFVDEDAFQAKLERELLARPEGAKLLQWQKLYLAFRDVEKAEAERNRPYDMIFKTRTDFVYDFPFELPEAKAGDNTLYMQGDLIFGGARECFARIADFIFPAMLVYYGNPYYLKINLRHIRECDLEAGRFLHLKWPLHIFGPTWLMRIFRRKRSKKDIKRLILQHADEISRIEDKGAGVYARKKIWLTRKFRSQSSFLHYVLSKDLIVKSIAPKRYKLAKERTRDDAPP
jgi:hypothetical protein